MSFTYNRIIYFKDTDAAGVVYFTNALSICHEAYEALLASFNIDVKQYFSGKSIAVPIVHAEIDFKQPMFCGDRIQVKLSGSMQKESSFTLSYQILDGNGDKTIAFALTKHVAINPETKVRSKVPTALAEWLNGLLH